MGGKRKGPQMYHVELDGRHYWARAHTKSEVRAQLKRLLGVVLKGRLPAGVKVQRSQ